MLELPSSLRLKRNHADERSLLEASREWLDRDNRTDGIHASDLLDLRQAYYRHQNPQPLGNREVGLFLVGKVLHSFVLATGAGLSPDLGISDEGSRYSEELGIWYSTDWDKGSVAEFKTSRRMTEPKTVSDLDIYVEQLLIYMAAKQVLSAKLWVLYLNLRDEESRRTTPTFRCFTIEISEADLLSVTETVSNQRQLLSTTLEKSDPSGLPLCRSWKCGEGNCSWWFDCRPVGRFGIDPKKWKS